MKKIFLALAITAVGLFIANFAVIKAVQFFGSANASPAGESISGEAVSNASYSAKKVNGYIKEAEKYKNKAKESSSWEQSTYYISLALYSQNQAIIELLRQITDK